MRAGKNFDCVAMKAEIQERLLREAAELGEKEAQERRAERLARDPILGAPSCERSWPTLKDPRAHAGRLTPSPRRAAQPSR